MYFHYTVADVWKSGFYFSEKGKGNEKKIHRKAKKLMRAMLRGLI